MPTASLPQPDRRQLSVVVEREQDGFWIAAVP